MFAVDTVTNRATYREPLRPVGTGDAVSFAVDSELVERVIGPIEGNLKNNVEGPDRAVATHQSTLPDHRAHPQPDPPSLIAEWIVGATIALSYCWQGFPPDFSPLLFNKKLPA